MSPLLFILLTACIIDVIVTDPAITKAAKGKQEVAAYMDDYKTHAPTKKSADLITNTLSGAAGELGLSLNIRKCGIYNTQLNQNHDEQEENENEEIDLPFLPIVREGYKYLGLEQLERDTNLNASKVEEMVLERSGEIFNSKLAPAQKVLLFNSTVIPAAVYITGNLYPKEKRASTLKRCSDMDKMVRKILVQKNLLGKTSSRNIVYIPTYLGGLGIKSILRETEIQYARRGVYLKYHQHMSDTNSRYERLQRAGWRNPLTDADFVFQKYNVDLPQKTTDESVTDYCRKVTKIISGKQLQILTADWSSSMHYGRLVMGERENIKFPALQDLRIDDWMATTIRSAAEEQIWGLGANPSRRRKCRLHCNVDETAYHVISSCITPAYTTRHDGIVHQILKSILYSTAAPQDIQSQLKYGQSSLVVEYMWGDRQVKIRAGIKIPTDPVLYHNRPDIIVYLTKPDNVYVLEIAVAHLQNIHLQEDIKKVRYSKNSTIHVNHSNYNTIPRNYNLIGALERMYRCPTKLGVLVFGALGEIVEGPVFKDALKMLNKLGIKEKRLQGLLNQCSLTAANSSAKIIMRRLGMPTNPNCE